MKRKREDLTQEEVMELLHYDPETGIFTNKVTRGSKAVRGAVAGHIHSLGYLIIRIRGVDYFAHRLAYLVMVGCQPPYAIDHRDGNPLNNSWANLRLAPGNLNHKNRRVAKNSTSRITGVNWHAHHKKWRARIGVEGKMRFLGYYDKKVDAAIARWNAEIKYGYTSRYQEGDILLNEILRMLKKV